jgi:hypothetical protein
VSDDLNARMQLIVSDIANDSSRQRKPEEPRYRADDDQPMTKREGREIIETIKGIPIYRGTETNELLAEIKALLAEIKAQLDTIKWGVVAVIVVFLLYKLWR